MIAFMRALHKWLALLAGLQVMVWLISGFVMNALDARVVSGEDLVAFDHDVQALPADAQIVEPARILAASGGQTVRALELKRQLGFWVWRVQTDTGTTLYNARTGERMTVTQAQARSVAEQGYFGEGAVSAVTLLSAPTLEARDHRPPLWRVDFNDERHTRYYIGADEGRILERRNDTWRAFDFFWMLHTMDYVGRDDFNNPWVVVFAFASLWMAISGIVLLVRSFRRPNR